MFWDASECPLTAKVIPSLLLSTLFHSREILLHSGLLCSCSVQSLIVIEVFFASVHENSIRLPSKGDLSLNGLRHLLILGANHLLRIFGIGFQLYGQLK